jgi:hypothetical protein
MLFDLRGRGRRRTVQVIYLTLAILLGGGLVLFGIGGDVQGGLVDALTGGSSGGGDNDVLEDDVEKAEERVKANRADAAAWAELAEAKTALADVSDGYDESTRTYGGDSRALALDAVRAWEQHVRLAGKKPDADAARTITRTFISLDQNEKAVSAWESVIDAKGEEVDWKDFSYLAELAYLAGQTRKGDLATQTALDRGKEQDISKERRDEEKAALDELKNEIAQQQLQDAQGGAGGAAPAPVQP